MRAKLALVAFLALAACHGRPIETESQAHDRYLAEYQRENAKDIAAARCVPDAPPCQ